MKIEGFEDLEKSELEDINGGFLPLVLVALEVYAGVCAVSYAAGYTVGTVEKLLKD